MTAELSPARTENTKLKIVVYFDEKGTESELDMDMQIATWLLDKMVVEDPKGNKFLFSYRDFYSLKPEIYTVDSPHIIRKSDNRYYTTLNPQQIADILIMVNEVRNPWQ